MDCCDLHCHSIFSDGSCSPEELVDLACGAGLRAVALTDHNTVGGLERFTAAAAGRIEVCAGCEISTDADDRELHLLGLFLNPEKMEPVQKALEEQKKRKEESNRITIERLAADGYDVSFDEFIADYGTGIKNRVHISRYLMKKGIISSIKEGFAGLLSLEAGYHQEIKRLDFYKMIPLIAEAGGVSVWAHPLFHVDREACEKIIQKAKLCGLDAAEVYYTTYTPDDTEFMRRVCAQNDLLESGGSDFHGENKPGQHIGVGYGNLQIPYSCYEKLKARADSRA